MARFPVLGPIEHSVLEITLDGGHSEMTIDEEPLAHSDGRPMEGISVPEPLEHLVLGWGGGPGQRTHGGDVTFRTIGAFSSECSPRQLLYEGGLKL